MTELSDLSGKTAAQIDDWFGTRGVGKHIVALQHQLSDARQEIVETLPMLDDDALTIGHLSRKVAYLKKVLAPFAQAAETWLPEEPDDKTAGARIEHPKYGMEPHAVFTFGDLFRARAALEDGA